MVQPIGSLKSSSIQEKDPYRLRDSPAQNLFNHSLKKNIIPESEPKNDSIYGKAIRDKNDSVLGGLENKLDKPPFNDRSNQNQGTGLNFGTLSGQTGAS